MTVRPDQWARVSELFDAVRPLPETDRGPALRARTAEKPQIVAEVEALLAADTDDDFLASDFGDAFGRLVPSASPLRGRTLGT